MVASACMEGLQFCHSIEGKAGLRSFAESTSLPGFRTKPWMEDIGSGLKLKLANGRIATQRETRDRDLSGRASPCAGLLWKVGRSWNQGW